MATLEQERDFFIRETEKRHMKVGTDCSGIDAPVVALRRMGVNVAHAFSCECDKHAKHVLLANHTPSNFYDDITQRDHAAAPAVDFYAAGFPCQSYSTMGRRAGRGDDRGRIFDHVRAYIESRRPGMFLLENVSNLVKMSKGQVFADILADLRALGYEVHHRILNTRHFGLPQYRERIYIVGFQQPKPSFAFPEETDERPTLLTLRELYDGETRPEVQLTEFEQTNVDTIVGRMRAKGWDLRQPHIFDAQRTPKWIRLPPGEGVAPCVTTRAARFVWYCEDDGGNRLPYYRLSANDALSLQGMPEVNHAGKSRSQIVRLAGNSMSVPVLQAIMSRMR